MAVPPAGIAVAVPVFPPKQFTFTCEEVTVRAAAGWVMVTEVLAVQPLESVTVTV